MHYRITIFAFCVVLVGFTKSDKIHNETPYVAPKDDIFIDEPQLMQADMVEGSAVDTEFTDDTEGASGTGPIDDEESGGSGFTDEEGSGTEPPVSVGIVPTTSTTTSTTTTTTTEHTISVKPSTMSSDKNRILEDSVSTTTVLDNTHSHDGNKEDNSIGPILSQKADDRPASFFAQPGILAAVIGGAVVGLLCAILLVMFIVYRMRKKDEGSYPLDEPKRSPTVNSYTRNTKEFYA